MRQVSQRSPTGPSRAASRPMRKRSGGSGCQKPAPHARLGPASLVLYGVSILYFETDAGDGFREPGFSRERRLEPPITIGLLTGQDGFPLMVSAFEGNQAETKTMLPVIEAVMAARRRRRRGLRDDLRGEPEGYRGRRAVVHPRDEDPGRPRPGRQ